MRPFSNRALIGLFLVMLWLPTLASLFHWDRAVRVNENRFASKFPFLHRPFGASSVKSFVAGVEQYFNDHFGFRQRLVYWNRIWKQRWFSETWESHVLVGRDQWLYATWSLEPMVEYENVTRPFNEQRLHEWQMLFETRRNWLRERGIPYLVVVPPDKLTAYPEYLLDWQQALGSRQKTDQFMSYMRDHSDVEILDLRAALDAGKKRDRTYFKTDSHWNGFGAYIAYDAIAGHLHSHLPDFKPIPVEAFELSVRDCEPGNLSWMLTGNPDLTEPPTPVLVPRPPLPPLLPVRRDNQRLSVLNTNASGRMMIFGDSFSEGMLSYFGYHFGEVVQYRLYNIDNERLGNDLMLGEHAHIWEKELIEKEKPDLVVDEILNSLLYIENPAAIRKTDGL